MSKLGFSSVSDEIHEEIVIRHRGAELCTDQTQFGGSL